MNFGIGSAFSKDPRSAFSDGPGPGQGPDPLYKVCQKEQTVTEAENLHTEITTLISFVVEQIYMVKKRSNNKDDRLLIKNLLDQIKFLKQELISKGTFIKIILENYRQTTDYKFLTVKETAKGDKGEREFLTARKTVEMRPVNNMPQFISRNRFDALRMTTDEKNKESDKQLIQNETDSHL